MKIDAIFQEKERRKAPTNFSVPPNPIAIEFFRRRLHFAEFQEEREGVTVEFNLPHPESLYQFAISSKVSVISASLIISWMEDTEVNDDFTFCQVSAPSDQNGFDEQNMVPGIRNISIKDEASSCNNADGNSTTTMKEEKVGSLAFNVISTTPQNVRYEVQKQAAQAGAGNSVKDSAERKPAAKKPVARAKVPFEKGYSQMDWLKVTRTHPDLAGLKGQSNKRLISMSEVKQHQTEGAMWTVLKGRVYNIYPYMKFHPGGVDLLMKAVGKDCTSLFIKYHAWVNAEFLLEKCLVGILDDGSQ